MTATTEDYNAGNAQAMAHAKKCWFEVRKQTRQNRVRRLNLVNETFVGRSTVEPQAFSAACLQKSTEMTDLYINSWPSLAQLSRFEGAKSNKPPVPSPLHQIYRLWHFMCSFFFQTNLVK